MSFDQIPLCTLVQLYVARVDAPIVTQRWHNYAVREKTQQASRRRERERTHRRKTSRETFARQRARGDEFPNSRFLAWDERRHARRKTNTREKTRFLPTSGTRRRAICRRLHGRTTASAGRIIVDHLNGKLSRTATMTADIPRTSSCVANMCGYVRTSARRCILYVNPAGASRRRSSCTRAGTRRHLAAAFSRMKYRYVLQQIFDKLGIIHS